MATKTSSIWTVYEAGHLLNRAGFGGSPIEVVELWKRGREAAVDWLLREGEETLSIEELGGTGGWQNARNVEAIQKEFRALDEVAREEAKRKDRMWQQNGIQELRFDWLQRMRRSQFPFREKLALFWHGHFATSVEKVREPFMLWSQLEKFRKSGGGDFRKLAKEMTKDPAMMRYLDSVNNRKGKPNENFAREMMELFCLGEGNYSEHDIQEAARAFTGGRINYKNLTYQFSSKYYDDGEKEMFGKRGNWDADGAVDLIVEHPACAFWITRKLWEFFVYENPEEEVVERYARKFQESGYQVKKLLREIFLSEEFQSKRAIRQQIKSPVQWLVQACRQLEISLPREPFVLSGMQRMGQILLAPPNVKGWEGGKSWINTSALLTRYNQAGSLVLGDGIPGGRSAGGFIAPSNLVSEEMRENPEDLLRQLGFRLFQSPLDPGTQEPFFEYIASKSAVLSDKDVNGLIHLMMCTPEYQVC